MLLIQVHELVHSLSMAEKKYLRRQARTGEQLPEYMRLFEVLNGMEAPIKTEFNAKTMGWKMRNNPSVALAYLRDRILSAMVEFGLRKSPYRQNVRRLEHINWLYTRGNR